MKNLSGYLIFALLIIGATIGCYYYLSWCEKTNTQKNEIEKQQIVSKEKKYQDSINYQKGYIDNLKDSIMGLLTEKGYIEIQLIKAETKLGSLVSNSKIVRIKKDTIQILDNCDSIIDVLGDSYVQDNIHFRVIADSIVIKYDSLQLRSDSIEKILNNQKHYLESNLNNQQIKVYDLTLKNSKANKRTLIFSIGSFIAGIVLMLIK